MVFKHGVMQFVHRVYLSTHLLATLQSPLSALSLCHIQQNQSNHNLSCTAKQLYMTVSKRTGSHKQSGCAFKHIPIITPVLDPCDPIFIQFWPSWLRVRTHQARSPGGGESEDRPTAGVKRRLSKGAARRQQGIGNGCEKRVRKESE